jgi:hypothetical protein
MARKGHTNIWISSENQQETGKNRIPPALLPGSTVLRVFRALSRPSQNEPFSPLTRNPDSEGVPGRSGPGEAVLLDLPLQ